VKRARTFIIFTPLLAAALLLAGCGFKLRGTLDLPENIRTVHLTAPSELRDDILALLESGGVGASTGIAEADASIMVSSERFSRRVLSVDPATGKEREFELAYTFAFGVSRSDSPTVIENGTVNLLRSYVFDPEAVIGSSREEDLLRDEMRRDAARQLMRRIEAALKR
jgi:LPS-assembly lipoprotein